VVAVTADTVNRGEACEQGALAIAASYATLSVAEHLRGSLSLLLSLSLHCVAALCTTLARALRTIVNYTITVASMLSC